MFSSARFARVPALTKRDSTEGRKASAKSLLHRRSTDELNDIEKELFDLFEPRASVDAAERDCVRRSLEKQRSKVA
jgi:hypothetical protein